jgi:uncharacterized protein
VSTFWRVVPDGVSVAVKVQPKARQPGLHGAAPAADGMRLRIGVSEPAQDGRANRPVCAALAKALHVAPSAIRITAGATAREKLLLVSGESGALAERLAAL